MAQPHKHRRSIRLKGYDYRQAGYYFVTIAACEGGAFFGGITSGTMRLNANGRILAECWNAIPEHFALVDADEFVVMPNHFHGILALSEKHEEGTACRAPTVERFGKPALGSVPKIIRSFKAAVTKRVNERRGAPGQRIWQRNFYEHVIRDEQSLNRIREYIATNPQRWEIDCENPHRKSNDEFDLWLASFEGRPER